MITLKNIKHFEAMSHETHCYTATVYVDGKRWGTVENDGQGGCDSVHPFKGGRVALEELKERVKKEYPHIDSKYVSPLHIVFGELVNEFLRKKELKKIMKRVSYVKPNEKGIWQLPAKYRPTPSLIAEIKATCDWAKGVTFFADLSEAEALKLMDTVSV